MGNQEYEWQNIAYVLKWFGKSQEESRKAYREYLQEGIPIGTRPDLVGGSLIRALGRWSEVASQRIKKSKKTRDDRILGSEAFVVDRMLKGAEDRIKRQLPVKDKERKVEEIIAKTCKKENISIHELRSGSRRGRLPLIRMQIAGILIDEYGLSLAELGRRLGVTTSAVSKMMTRHE